MYYAVRSATLNFNGCFIPSIVDVNLNNFINYTTSSCLNIRWVPVFCNVSTIIPIPLVFINSTTNANSADTLTIFIKCIWGSVALENEYGEVEYSIEGPVTEVTHCCLISSTLPIGGDLIPVLVSSTF
ncbi:hypothetical protein [Acidianus ambivalens]|uniref:Uncharacterized protein n=1 Tax=Acidianus ambivalens TaxID=2283 RepID=A0A650CWG1_ACIAM|nr:hypothetical protein [Acidianus ambivalens]MQL54351.1 hypothetical protein [Acidianus ambivalens]QGR22176.1 hypothetical protein D1866_09425 [Acidianus ambivalens]